MMMAASLTRCRVPGCKKYAQEVHHIYTRGANKSKALVQDNEFDSCRDHHSEAHTLGRDSWAEKYGLEDIVLKARLAVKGY